MSDDEQHIGQLIRQRREALGWSQADLAQRAGTNQQTIDRLERGETKHSRALSSILDALRLPFVDAVSIPDQSKLNRVAGSAALTPPQYRPKSGPSILRPPLGKNLPIYGSQPSSEGFRRTLDPVDWWVRPYPIESVNDAYALIVPDETMAPAYRAGDIVLMNPHTPARIGDEATFSTGDDPCTFKLGLLREHTYNGWKIETFNPAGSQFLPGETWKTADVIIARFIRR